MENMKEIKRDTNYHLQIFLIFFILVFSILAIILYKEEETKPAAKMILFFFVFLPLIAFNIVATKTIKNYKIREKAKKWWTISYATVTEIKKTWWTFFWEIEYEIIAEDEEQIYTSESFYAWNIDEYVKIWDKIKVYKSKEERLCYYLDLKSIESWEAVKITNNINNNKNKISGTARNDKWLEKISWTLIWTSLLIMWIIILKFNPILSIIMIVFWLIVFIWISWNKGNINKHQLINTWDEVEGEICLIEKTWSIRWKDKYKITVKADWEEYESDETFYANKYRIWDKIKVYINKNNPKEYYVNIKNTTEYMEELSTWIGKNLKENSTVFYHNPQKIIEKEEEKIDKPKNSVSEVKNELKFEDKYPYLELKPKKINLITLIIRNRKNTLSGFAFLFFWWIIIKEWYINWIRLIIIWIILTYQIIISIHHFLKQELLVKIWEKKLTKICRIDKKEKKFKIVTSKKEEDDKEGKPEYYYIIYTTDWENEYKSFDIELPMATIWDPLYVYINPKNPKSYRVDTTNITINIYDFITKLFGKILWLETPGKISN